MATNSLTAFAPGDPSVGIPSQSWTINDIGEVDAFITHREHVRAAFAKAFRSLVPDGERVTVMFEDELR